MEREKLVEEKNNRRNSSTTRVPKSVEAAIKIDSIYIDLGISMEKKDTRKSHQHFSIRGYVSEMRDKDIQDSKPFPSEPLEPLVVRRFRYWRCEKCCQEIFAASASQVVLDSCEASLNVNGDKGCESCSEKEKSPKVDNMAVDGPDHQNSMEVDEIRQNGNQTLDPARSPPSLIEEANQDGTVAVNEISEATRADEVEKHALAETENTLDEEHENLTREKAEEIMKIDDNTTAVKDKERHPTLQLKGRRRVSSGTSRRKPRKVRFLSEILARNEPNSDIDKTKVANDNPIREETTTLAKYSRKRKRNLPLALPGETPSANNEARDAREIQGDTESAVGIIDISDSDSKEDASSIGMCWESAYKPLERTGDISCSSTLKGKMPLFDDEQMKQEKAMPNFEIGESSTANRCFGEEMLQYVNESIARTTEILRRRQLSGKFGNMSAAVAPNHFPAGSVDVPNNHPSHTETHEHRQDLNKEKKIMEFDLNLLAPNDEDLEAVAALQLLCLRDPERQLIAPSSNELRCILNRNPADFSFACKENEYMVQLIKGNQDQEN